jgi:hypothetical protein
MGEKKSPKLVKLDWPNKKESHPSASDMWEHSSKSTLWRRFCTVNNQAKKVPLREMKHGSDWESWFSSRVDRFFLVHDTMTGKNVPK